MKLREMKMGDVGIINIGNDKQIIMRSYSKYDTDNMQKIAFYILGSNGTVCSGDAFDFCFYVKNMDRIGN